MRAAVRQVAFAASMILAAAAVQAAPAPHSVPDTLAQRLQACAACHGKEGVATPQGFFPRIAGKPEGYLYNQLLNFRDGRRNNGVMSRLLENMSDAYLRDIATYFSELELPYSPPTAAVSAATQARGDTLVNLGDAARGLPACVSCHGSAMTGVSPSIPGLLGLPKDYLLSQFGAWRSGQRRAAAPDCMKEISQRLSTDDLGAVAAYLAARPVPSPAQPAASATMPLPLPCGGLK